MKLRNIEILENDKNKKGDLFGRLMSDLFHVLGYEKPRLNIHKTGREIDLNARHRTESKIAIAECKAHNNTIGGADINKFVGVIDAEKRKLERDSKNIEGYFISLSGFKETAIEQEKECGNDRVILIESEKIVQELIKGKILVSIENAISSLSSLTKGVTLLNYVDLLAYENGWVWAFYYSDYRGQKASHFALVHAEGKPLIKDLAENIAYIGKKLFEDLTLLNKDESTVIEKQNLESTRKKYFEYLERELGKIDLKNPAEKDTGIIRVKLENIFVPLLFDRSKSKSDWDSDRFSSKQEGIGEILNEKSKLAILAKPGGGKSTLIKRIATAYAFPERRELIDDDLPNKNWFPIFLRCRELGDRITESITDIIHNIPNRAEIKATIPSAVEDFSIIVSETLQNGNALLLIDGLDEIAEESNRIKFVEQLRIFIATYPTLNIIVTSREAGFRSVAPSLASYCENYTVSNLTNPEIKKLCLNWHKAIIDESDNTVIEAEKLSDLILNNSRIKFLSENPLLLTTLFFVKRWVGYLPAKVSVLYQEMIKVLLVTWGAEAHVVLDIEETEPQLAFVAYWMTKNGQQTILKEDLEKYLMEARKQMPEILGYTKVSPHDFIKQVELRSGLLIMSGLDDFGKDPVYEFMHLNFQEYLTAKAIAEKFIPKSDHKDKIVDIIKPYINNENWKEVIPFVAVLSKRESKDLIDYLIKESKDSTESLIEEELKLIVPEGEEYDKKKNKREQVASLLERCLANEIQINPDLLGTAIEWYAKSGGNKTCIKENNEILKIILQGKFGNNLREKVKECFFERFDDKYAFSLGTLLSEIFFIDINYPKNHSSIPKEILLRLKSKSEEEMCIAILGMLSYAHNIYNNVEKEEKEHLQIPESEEIFSIMFDLLKMDKPYYRFAISWCISWAGEANIFPDSQRIQYVTSLAKIWIESKDNYLKRVTSSALCTILIPTITKQDISEIKELPYIIQQYYDKPENRYDKITAIYFGTILGNTYDKNELEETFNNTTVRLCSNHDLFVKKLNLPEKKQDIFDW